jgi:hypothetical protein
MIGSVVTAQHLALSVSHDPPVPWAQGVLLCVALGVILWALWREVMRD